MDAEGCYNGMPEGEPEMDAGEGTRSGRSSQKWMLEPEVDARREEGLNNTTKRRRLPRNGLARKAGSSRRDAFIVKAAES